MPIQREIQPDEQRAGLMKLQKKSLEKKKTLYLKVNYNLGYIPQFGINQDRVEISIKTKPQQAVTKLLHTFVYLDSSRILTW